MRNLYLLHETFVFRVFRYFILNPCCCVYCEVYSKVNMLTGPAVVDACGRARYVQQTSTVLILRFYVFCSF